MEVSDVPGRPGKLEVYLNGTIVECYHDVGDHADVLNKKRQHATNYCKRQIVPAQQSVQSIKRGRST